MASSIDFEGRPIPIGEGDTIASALYRAGVRTFSRSFKYHRPRGLYCCTGDCPNCLVTVDDEPAVKSCTAPARAGQRVARGNAVGSADWDALGWLWYARALLPVGFYYKSMIRPRFLWLRAEPVIRRIAGLGPVSTSLPETSRERLNHHADVFVAGGGVAGLAAALAASEAGSTVVLAEEGGFGETLPPGRVRERVEALASKLRGRAGVTLLERSTVVGIYEGPLVPVAGPDYLHLVQPGRIVVATGAAERHGVFPGNDLPGVWLGRGAARMAGVHGQLPGRRIVYEGRTPEALEQLATLMEAGAAIEAALLPGELADAAPPELRVIRDGTVEAVRGRRRVRSAVVRTGSGRETIGCDAVVLALGYAPRDGLLRQSIEAEVSGAGDVVVPGCGVEEAERAGRAAGTGGGGAPVQEELPSSPEAGMVCLCEDVGTKELVQAWDEGYRNTELLKRYTTCTMGPCQGAMCQRHLRAFVAERQPETRWTSAATTARPPARTVRLEDLAAGLRVPLEYHTALHQRHAELGATFEWAGVWRRAESYGDPAAEYDAVRKAVSIMDVGTLGKYRIAGPDATAFMERLLPIHVADLRAGRSRYMLALNEMGYVFDDGLVCRLQDGEGYYVTFTSGGGDHAEAWMRDFIEEWRLRVHLANLTATWGAINVAGPRARELLVRLSDAALEGEAFPYAEHREITVAGVPCLALRVGFVGELSFELHHPALQSVRLWDALLEAGEPLGLRPHGLEALRLLRLEKGHIIVGQDTDFDATPAKIGMKWAVKMEKPDFVGKLALERLEEIGFDRKLVRLSFPGQDAPPEGAQLFDGDAYCGHLTSSRFSPTLGQGVALGWVRRQNGAFPEQVTALGLNEQRVEGSVARKVFYDPEGERQRA